MMHIHGPIQTTGTALVLHHTACVWEWLAQPADGASPAGMPACCSLSIVSKSSAASLHANHTRFKRSGLPMEETPPAHSPLALPPHAQHAAGRSQRRVPSSSMETLTLPQCVPPAQQLHLRPWRFCDRGRLRGRGVDVTLQTVQAD
jgi:hypothetical protein